MSVKNARELPATGVTWHRLGKHATERHLMLENCPCAGVSPPMYPKAICSHRSDLVNHHHHQKKAQIQINQH